MATELCVSSGIATQMDATVTGVSIVALDPNAARAEWESLARRLDAPPFVRPGWLLEWYASFGTGALVLWGAVRDGELVGALPLQAKWGVLSSPTNWHTPSFGVLAEDDDVADELLLAVVRQTRGQLVLSFLDERTAGMVASAAERVGYSSHCRVIANSPYLPLHGSSEDYFASRSRRFNRETRRRQRDLEELGAVSTVVKTSYDERTFAELLRVEGSGWKGRQGTALASDPTVERFYREVSRWAGSEGWLRLSLLCVDETAIAADLSIAAAGRMYGMKTGYDERFGTHMPGILLTTALITRALDHEDLESFEFLGTDSSYKMRWTSSSRPRLRVHVFPVGLRGRLFRAVQVHVRPMASTAARWWRTRTSKVRPTTGSRAMGHDPSRT